MKASTLQTPRQASSARSKETPSPKRSDPNSGKWKSQKIVPNRLTWEFSAAPEEIHPDPLDPVDSSPENTSTVEDPAEMQKPPISLFLGSSEMDEVGVVESGELTCTYTDSDAVKKKGEVKEMEEGKVKALLVMDRVREALLEISASGVSDESKKAVEALVEIALGDASADSRAKDGLSDLVLWANVRISILFFLIWLVLVIHALVATALWFGRGWEEAFVGSPPT